MAEVTEVSAGDVQVSPLNAELRSDTRAPASSSGPAFIDRLRVDSIEVGYARDFQLRGDLIHAGHEMGSSVPVLIRQPSIESSTPSLLNEGTVSDFSEDAQSKGASSAKADYAASDRSEAAGTGFDRFELEEVGSDASDSEGIEIVQPDLCEDAESEKSDASPDNSPVMDLFTELQVAEKSTDEDIQKRILVRKKKRWSAARFKRPHSESVEGESSYSDDDPWDDTKPKARRLRRRLSPRWRDGFPYQQGKLEDVNRNEEVEEPKETNTKHTVGPPSIPSDDAFKLDELPFWGAYATLEFGDDSSKEYLVEYDQPDMKISIENEMNKALGEQGKRPVVDRKGSPSITSDKADTLGGLPLRSEDIGSGGSRISEARMDHRVIQGSDENRYEHHITGPILAVELTRAHERISHDSDDEKDRESVQSIESSMTLVSTLSGYTSVEVESATFELRRVLQEDENLIELYRTATENVNIGADRLQRNLRRLIKQMALELRDEAVKELERQVSRFIALKARSMAYYIVEDLRTTQPINQMPRLRHQQPHEKLEPEGKRDKKLNESESEHEDNFVDEDDFQDLAIFRTFLVESEAFRVFQARLAAFVNAKAIQIPGLNVNNEISSTATWSSGYSNLLGWLENTYIAILDATGLTEPPIPSNAVRLKWNCTCGDTFSSDVYEYRPGGVKRLTERMQRSGCLNVTITTHNNSGNRPKYALQSPPWLQTIRKRLSSTLIAWTSASPDVSCLPQHQDSRTADGSSTLEPEIPLTERERYIMMCLHRTKNYIKVNQALLQEVTTDRQLFCFLKDQMRLHYSSLRILTSMKHVKRILFVKFRLHQGSRAEVREHATCCQQICECLPPERKVIKPPMGSGEYDCNPCGSLDTWPPVTSELMMHSFDCPQAIGEKARAILEQVPKKMDSKIDETDGQPLPEGWGLHFQEGINASAVCLLVLIASVVAGLLFLVLWTVLKDDIQGASGVSAYIVAVASVALFWIATKSESFR